LVEQAETRATSGDERQFIVGSIKANQENDDSRWTSAARRDLAEAAGSLGTFPVEHRKKTYLRLSIAGFCSSNLELKKPAICNLQ
jgi:hypothetical protein